MSQCWPSSMLPYGITRPQKDQTFPPSCYVVLTIHEKIITCIPSGKFENTLIPPHYERLSRTMWAFWMDCFWTPLKLWDFLSNKANLRDLIAATGLVISNWIQIVNFSACVTVKFDGWPCKNIGHLSYATSSFVHHFVAIGEYKLELQSGNAQSGSN